MIIQIIVFRNFTGICNEKASNFMILGKYIWKLDLSVLILTNRSVKKRFFYMIY
jgi:hypothetical protein